MLNHGIYWGAIFAGPLSLPGDSGDPFQDSEQLDLYRSTEHPQRSKSGDIIQSVKV
jgi:hypothetical protein